MRLLDKLEGIIRESVRPMEKIDGIKILHVDGLGGGGATATWRSGGTAAISPTSIVNSALRYRAQAPLIDRLLKEMGMMPALDLQLGDMLREASRRRW